MLTYFLCWFPMLLLAIANGTARDLWYKKYIGELRAHQLSTLSFLLLLAVYIGFIINRFPPSSGVNALFVGLGWVILTLLFEFGFGLARGNKFQRLLEDYNISKGRLWVLVPTWLLIAPYIFYRLYN
jgi:chromate transport protein ChrA